MKRFILAVTAIGFFAASTFGKAKLVEKIDKSGSGIVIPYERYVLSNGLTLLVHEDHSDPIVHVDVTYHVGSAREEIGKSGFAHFFEHMMFQGSDHVADEQHFKIITEAGGTLNGSTNRDRTNYFETVPSNQLEKMLWLESDRMGFLVDAVTQKKFEVQRATVKNERGQRYDNVPYGLVSEVMAKNMYPYGHPYSWLTIGYVEDLNRVNVDDLKNFFLRWYGPNNAVLTVGGDVNTKDVVALVEKYFEPIPKGPEVKPVTVPAVVIDKDRYVSMTDNYAKLPSLRIAFAGVPSYHKDEAALDCLAEILGQGKNSILYKKFIKTQKAVNASVYNNTTELSGEFVMSVTPYPGQKLADIEKEVRVSIYEFEKRGVTDEDIEKFRNSREADLINGLESVSGKVSQLAAFYTFTGNANYIGEEMKRYTAVTKEDVIRVYNQYIKDKHAVVLSVLTKGQETNKAGEDNYTVSEEGYKAPNYGYSGLKYNKAKDNFDRSAIPGNGPAPIVKVPEYWRSSLPGDINVIGTKSDEIPVVNILIRFKGGKMMDAGDASKAGLSNLFAAMMEEDTKNYSAEAFSVALDKLGSSIDVSADVDGIQVSVRTLSKNLDKTMALVEERILRPDFTEDAFNTNKKRIAENIKNSLVRPNYVANIIYNKLIYGTNNVLGWPTTGTETTVNNIKLADVQDYYNKNITGKNAEVVIVGDVAKEILPKLAFLQQLPNKDIILPTLPAAPQIEKTKIYFVNIPNAAQTEFRIGNVTGMRFDALGDYYKSTIMNYPLGGAFNSRLNLDLREDKGWTYGARSGFEGDKYTGTHTFSAGIKAAATDSAMMDVIRIMREYKTKGVTTDELGFTQKSITQSDARKYEAGFQKALFLSRIMEYDLPSDFAKKQNALLGKLTVKDINAMALKYLPDIDKTDVVLVGDKAKVWDGIQKLGYEVVELDKDGNPVKN
jgi:zinc protease